VNAPLSFLSLAKKLTLMALIGFLVITLVGPVVALVSLLVPFALIGYAVWWTCRWWVGGRPGLKERLDQGKEWGEKAWHGAHEVGARAMCRVRDMGAEARTKANFVGALLVEATSGVLVGVFLVLLGNPGQSMPEATVCAAGTLGGFIGVLAALGRRPGARQTADALN
jgi:hypothetical protein